MQDVFHELKIWSVLKHENIHQLLGITRKDGCLALVSEWMNDGTVTEYMRKHPNAEVIAMVGTSDGLLSHNH